MRLHEALGLPDPEREGGQEPPAALLDGARRFREAGGVLTLREWAEQSHLERRALLLAGAAPGSGSDAGALPAEQLQQERQALLQAKRLLLEALSARGHRFPEGPASLGAALEELELRGMVRAIAQGFPLEDAVARFEAARAGRPERTPAVAGGGRGRRAGRA